MRCPEMEDRAGENASRWAQCQQLGRHRHRVAGGAKLPRLRPRQALRKALIEVGGKAGGNAPEQIRYFVQEIQKGHIIVANNGRSEVVGVGIVDSDYIPPQDEKRWRRAAFGVAPFAGS